MSHKLKHVEYMGSNKGQYSFEKMLKLPSGYYKTKLWITSDTDLIKWKTVFSVKLESMTCTLMWTS